MNKEQADKKQKRLFKAAHKKAKALSPNKGDYHRTFLRVLAELREKDKEIIQIAPKQLMPIQPQEDLYTPSATTDKEKESIFAGNSSLKKVLLINLILFLLTIFTGFLFLKGFRL